MQMKTPSEKIVTVGPFGYMKLFNDHGVQENEDFVYLDDNDEWKKVFWRFYWRVH